MDDFELFMLGIHMSNKEWNPRYKAWAHKHGRMPGEQLVADEAEWPGGCMTGFTLWIQDRASVFNQLHYPRASLCMPDAFTEFLIRNP